MFDFNKFFYIVYCYLFFLKNAFDILYRFLLDSRLIILNYIFSTVSLSKDPIIVFYRDIH